MAQNTTPISFSFFVDVSDTGGRFKGRFFFFFINVPLPSHHFAKRLDYRENTISSSKLPPFVDQFSSVLSGAMKHAQFIKQKS